ncbi:nuclear receptor coactivator 5 isoform X2 [Stigmatopora nigra]
MAQKGRIYKGYRIDVNMAVERRSAKPHSQQSPPRRAFGGYGDGKEPRPRSRSRSPGNPREPRDRDARDPRDRDNREGRDGRSSPGREQRPGSHPRDHEYRYRGSEGRDKDLRGPRDPAYKLDYDRYYRGGNPAEDYYRRKDEPFRDQYRDPWNGRREAEDDRVRPEERRRNELYRQYYEELQRRQETDRPVDCSVIVVNKAQNREYAETVGRKVHDLGMVVDLIFLNTEVSLTQALEDVGRARTPFAIIITQQHQVHRSCTVNILFGTPQEHRNMPMQDAMMLISHNYDTYKMENREKEREEIARKAAKMADEVLLRDPDRESHPVTVLTSITLLAENRFLTPEELEGMISYLTDKRARLVRNPADPLAAAVLPATADVPSAVGMGTSAMGPGLSSRVAQQQSGLMAPQSGLMAQQQTGLMASQSSHMASQSSHMVPQSSHMAPHSAHMGPQSGHMASQSMGSQSASLGAQSNSNQELQAKILSLFKSTASSSASSTTAQSQDYGSARSAGVAAQGYGVPMGRGSAASPGGPRAGNASGGINFDNPSVQKALDTLIQSGPALNHLVNSGSLMPQQQQQQQQMHHQSQMHQQSLQAGRPAANMGQMQQMYPRHY